MEAVRQDEDQAESPQSQRLSYKFQRLRERLRAAVVSGELSGKLPGERELARRFSANPKTLSKALTDLAGEGLLDRSIGRGTFVRGCAHPAMQRKCRGLLRCDADQVQSTLVQHLRRQHADLELITSDIAVRPSMLSQFDAVIDVSAATPEAFHRSLLVRGISVLLIGREPGACKVHAVVLDRAHAAHCAARHLFLSGHRRVLVVEEAGSSVVLDSARAAAERYVPDAAVEHCTINDTESIINPFFSAILCSSHPIAEGVNQVLETAPQPSRPSLAAIGVTDAPVCTGVFAGPAEMATLAMQLLHEGQQHRPTVFWMTGTYHERGTVRAVADVRTASPEVQLAIPA
jgi:DNA-binding transcriptional regulator YhcF (GntR family)